eukprot:TRINITY_DN12183_c0_g1_i1.p1 TRINITY_DN12183_c0_g1~~TRINITY_DN12183_c0_g1_i1.p1  ORF type:complete len:382 (-),score=35.97 TRINITY_DN12183_c0_g1_i1:160-1305(-)
MSVGTDNTANGTGLHSREKLEAVGTMSLHGLREAIGAAALLPEGGEKQLKKRQLWRQLQRFRETSDVSDDTIEVEEKRLYLGSKKKTNVLRWFRLVAILCWWLLWVPWMFVVSPLRLLHPLLRKIGLYNGILPLDLMARAFNIVNIFLACVKVELEGYEHIDPIMKSHIGVLMMFQHASNLDGFVISSVSPIVFKWVGKESLYKIPIFGWIGYLYGGIIGINRENRESAINSLKHARDVMFRWKRSVAIAPEGSRQNSGQLGPFKKGPFHLALDVKTPILPLICFGANELWPPGQVLPSSGTVVVKFQRVLPVEEWENLDYNGVLELVRHEFFEGTESYPKVFKPSFTVPLWFYLLNLLALPVVPYLLYLQASTVISFLFF